MVRKIYEIGEKENPRKKYRGIFENIFPFGYGSGRLILIKNKTGKKIFSVDWRELTKQRREKNITIGDEIKIDYEDDYKFTIKKLTGK